MKVSKRRASASTSEVQSSSTTHRTSSRTVTTISRKLLDEKENMLRRGNHDKRKALNERQNLSDYYHEDYFDSGSYRADCIGKPWRSPNLSRRGIHSTYEGCVQSYSGSGEEIISSTSWQSTGFSRGDQSAFHIVDEGECGETNIEVNRLQTSSETNNSSNSNLEMRTRAMRLSEQKDEISSGCSLSNFVAANSNNNASQKRGARLVTMWKTSGIPDDISEDKFRRLGRSATSRISSIFGFDKEDASSNVRVTRSQTRKLTADQELEQELSKSGAAYKTEQTSTTISSRIVSWIHTSIFITIIRKFLYRCERLRVKTGAPCWPLIPCYAVLALFRWLSSTTVWAASSGLRKLGLLLWFMRTKGAESQNQKESVKSKSAIAIVETKRSRKYFLCCPCPWAWLLLLLPLLLLLALPVTQDKGDDNVRSEFLRHCGSMINWTVERVVSIPRFFMAALVSVKESVVAVFLTNDNETILPDPSLSGKSGGGIDSKLYQSLIKSIRDHSARLAAQEKELKAQKALLDKLAASHTTSDQTSKNLAIQINKWEGDLKSVQSQLSSLDAALDELKKLKLSTKAASGDSGVNSKEVVLLSKQVEAIAAEQAKQKGLSDQLTNLQALLVKLEGHVKEQKEWTTLELKKHEGEFQKLAVTFRTLESKGDKTSGSADQVSSEFSADLKALSDKVMADHERLVAFESQQQSLQALLVDLEKRLSSETVSTRTKDSANDKSFASITAKLQSLEVEQKTLSQRLDLGLKQHEAGAKVSTVNLGAGCSASGGQDCASITAVQELIDRALAIFAADRIARPDFALESAGGSIIGTRCTQTYTDRPAVFSLFGIPLFRMSRSPRTVIQPALYPGECWAFRGPKGQLVVRLASNIEVSGITLEHVPKSLSPNGRIDSAPRRFAVKGLASESDYTGVKLGEFEYLDKDQPLQTFDLKPPLKVFRYIELQILSNHGHSEYTCVYRLRVHGKIVADAESDSEVR